MHNSNERMLIQYVQQEIASGKQSLSIPASLTQNVSKEILKEVRSLCKLAGATIRSIEASR